MMSVFVRGMEIPKNCAECRFCVNGFTDDAPMYECACQSYDNVSVLVDKEGQPFDFRPDWCPLIEVQTPHGRLIDADALVNDCEKYIKSLNPDRDGKEIAKIRWLVGVLNGQQTIVGKEA